MRTRFEIYCDILRQGLLSIRAYSKDADYCFAVADHLHNLPELLMRFDDENLHRFYWEIMRTSFVKRSKPEWVRGYSELWQELEAANRREAGT